MNSSDKKYISVSSPQTCNMSKKHVPQNVLMQPNFHPVNWKMPPVSERGFASSLHDSQESDSESLVQERQYQLELQQRIHENEELVGLYFDELEKDSLEEDSLEQMSLKEQEGAEYDTNQCTHEIQKNDGNGRKQQSVDKYFSLRYNPNWKNTEFSVAEKACQVAGGSNADFSQDSFYLRSIDSPEEKNQQEAKSQESFLEFGTEFLSFHERKAVVSTETFRLHTKGKESADGCHFKHSPSGCGSAFSLQIQGDRPHRAKIDFVEKNKRTLGLRSNKINSYLQLHSKKQEALQEQVTDPKAVDEEPVQSVLPFQTVKMKPEDKWYLKAQQLKDHQNKSSQRDKIKSNQSLRQRAFPRNDSQHPTGRPAKPKSWHHGHHQVSGFRTAPLQAVEQDNSGALQKRLYPSHSVDPDTNAAANSNTCLNNFPNSRHTVNQDFTTSTYPSHPTLHKFNPAEVITPAYTSKESKKYQRNSPNGLPHDRQHLYNHVSVQLFARDNNTNGQAHPHQRNISSTFHANFQELVKDRASLQDCKRHIYVDKRPSQSSVHSSPTAPCTTSLFTQMMEQHHQEITHLTEGHLADLQLFSLHPPTIPQTESGSEVDPESGEGNRVKTNQSNSEGYFMEKQKQPKFIKKPCHSKPYINLNVKLGGLGPDYEAIKEKKEKLKQQKEYAKQIKEHNMKNIASVQRLPTKPQVVSSVSRQKALEYAKKIPRPKTFTARQSNKEVKEERVLPWTLNGDRLPQIATLETLQNRHEKEKEVIAAFRTLHIF
ncbi:jhy protein homolog [Falco naumanni]|uniref:jhy protein homolog n=1 Tax=Falco naumanni TaxID=148594 RepID=UPI001ADEAB8C|nr:jhy protein homolog [Falco naumanni]